MSNNISAKRKNPDYLQVFTKPNRDPTSVEAEHVEINRGQIQDLQDSTRDPATYRLYQHEVLSPPVCNQVDGQDCKRRRVSDSTPSESVTCNDVRDIENIQATPTPNCIGSDLLNEKKLKTPQSALIVEKYLRLGEELRDCKSQLKQIMDQQTVASRAAEDISEEFKCGICQETFIDVSWLDLQNDRWSHPLKNDSNIACDNTAVWPLLLRSMLVELLEIIQNQRETCLDSSWSPFQSSGSSLQARAKEAALSARMYSTSHKAGVTKGN